MHPAGHPKDNDPSSGFTLIEVMLAALLCSFVFIAAMYVTVFTSRMKVKLTTQADMQSEGRLAFERVMQTMRENFLSIRNIEYQMADKFLTNGLRINVDTNADGVEDGIIGWYLYPERSSYPKTFKFVETRSGGLPGAGTRTLCSGLVVPWTSVDGSHHYRPFEYRGSEPRLDIGSDGISDTGDLGEKDGVVDEEEIGNFYNGNGVIDHPSEIALVDSIGVGFKLRRTVTLQEKTEDVLIYQGTVSPRNWIHSGRLE